MDFLSVSGSIRSWNFYFVYVFTFQTQPATTEARSVFLEKAKLAGEACSRGEFILAVELYTDAINLDPQNHVLYGNRSAAFIRTRQFERALEDGRYAVQLQPSWSKVGN